MSILTEKISALSEAAQRYEEAQSMIAVLHDAVTFAHQEVKDVLDGNAPTQAMPAVQEEAPEA